MSSSEMWWICQKLLSEIENVTTLSIRFGHNPISQMTQLGILSRATTGLICTHKIFGGVVFSRFHQSFQNIWGIFILEISSAQSLFKSRQWGGWLKIGFRAAAPSPHLQFQTLHIEIWKERLAKEKLIIYIWDSTSSLFCLFWDSQISRFKRFTGNTISTRFARITGWTRNTDHVKFVISWTLLSFAKFCCTLTFPSVQGE